MTYKIVGSPTFSLYFERLLCKKGWCLTDKNQELWTITWLSDNVPVTVLARGRIGTWAVWVRRDGTEMCNISHLTNVHQIISAACLKAFCECTCINNGISSVWGCFYGWSVVVYCCCFVLNIKIYCLTISFRMNFPKWVTDNSRKLLQQIIRRVELFLSCIWLKQIA